MEEDEDVLAANSPVFQHLKSIGIDSVELKSVDGTSCDKSTTAVSTDIQKRELIDSGILDTVRLITATNLLFEDDKELIELVFSNFGHRRNETLRYMLSGKLSAFVALFGLFLFLRLGYFAFVVVSLFYAYRLTEHLWETHRKQLRFKKFIALLSSNFKLFSNVIKFLSENEALLKAKFGEEPPSRVASCLLNLKEDLLEAQQDVNKLLVDSTCILLCDVPLQESFDSPEGYICHEVRNLNEEMSVSQLHHLYMLLQSQLLTRLSFSIVPLLVNQPEQASKIVDATMLKIVIRLREISGKLNRKYKFLLRNGVYLQKDAIARPMPIHRRTTCSDHDSLKRNIHDVSNSLQYLLVRSRELESMLESEQSHVTGKELEVIQSELALCQQHISDILIMCSKGNKPLDLDDSEMRHEVVAEDEEVTATDIGFSDLDPRVDDDIFEAIIDAVDQEDKENWSEEEIDPLAKKKQRELLGELKTKLKGKAENWAARESAVLARKGLAPAETNVIEVEKVEEEEDNPLQKRKIKTFNYGDSSDEDDSREQFRPMFPMALPKGGLFLQQEMDEFTGSGQNSEESETEQQ